MPLPKASQTHAGAFTTGISVTPFIASLRRCSAQSGAAFALFLAATSTARAGATITNANWTGNASTVWNNPGNWDPAVPTGGTTAIIDTSGGNQPIIDNAVTPPNLVTIGKTGASDATTLLTITNGVALTIGSDIYLGDGGTGGLAVSDAASVTSSNFFVGNSVLGVASIANGTLTIIHNSFIASGSSSIGTVTVTGANSTWNNSGGSLSVGFGGTGNLAISGGGNVSSSNAFLGYLSGASGIATVSGANSSWNNTVNIFIGVVGMGNLAVSNGGTLSSGFGIYLGDGNTGNLTVSGGSFVNSGNLFVGNLSSGVLTVTNGTLTIAHDSFVASENSSNGTVTVTGANSTWINSGGLNVGFRGNGTLAITSGGNVTVSTNASFGTNAGGTGNATVDGSGSVLNIGGDLTLGNSGTGNLTITNSGLVVVTGALAFAVGSGSSGTLNVNDGGVLQLGTGVSAGEPTYAVNLGGGTLKASTAIDVGTDITLVSSTTSSFDTNGTHSSLSGVLSGGGAFKKIGTGTLDLTNINTYTGNTEVDGGTLAIGTGAAITATNDLNVGINTTGNLTISGGGNITATNVEFGYSAVGIGTIDGAGSFLSASGYIDVGDDGVGNLSVTNGGNVSTTASVFIGYDSVGNVSVDGAGSLLSAGNIVYVGYSSVSNLSITNSGQANSAHVVLGNASTVNLNNAGVMATTDITNSGTGLLNFNGGTLRATGNTSNFIANFTAGQINLGAGNGTIDDGGFNVVIAAPFNGTGGLTKTGPGVVTFGSVSISDYSGTTTVNQGTFNLDGTLQHSSVVVNSGALLSGNGSIGGSVTLNVGGKIDPGSNGLNSLVVLGNVTWNGANTFTPTALYDLSNTDNTSDLLAIGGNLTKGTGSAFQFDFLNSGFGTFDTPTIYTLITYSGTTDFVSSDFSYTNLGGVDTHGFFNIGGGSLTFTVIPEPSEYALALGAVALLVAARRRNRA